MAYYGGTRNPNATQTGDTTAVSVGTDPCTKGPTPCSYNLSGYAFLATNPTALTNFLTAAMTAIQSGNYSFSSQASIAAARVQGEKYLYEASFDPKAFGSKQRTFLAGSSEKISHWNKRWIVNLPDGTRVNIGEYILFHKKYVDIKGASGYALTGFNTSNMTDAHLGGGATATTCGTLCNLWSGFIKGTQPTIRRVGSWATFFMGIPYLLQRPSHFFMTRGMRNILLFFLQQHNRRLPSANSLYWSAPMTVSAFFPYRKPVTVSIPSDCTTTAATIWSFIPSQPVAEITGMKHISTPPTARTLTAISFLFRGRPFADNQCLDTGALL